MPNFRNSIVDHNTNDQNASHNSKDLQTRQLNEQFDDPNVRDIDALNNAVKQGGSVLAYQLARLNSGQAAKVHQDQSRLNWREKPGEILVVVDKIKQGIAEGSTSLNVTNDLEAMELEQTGATVTLSTYAARIEVGGKEIEIEITPSGNIIRPASPFVISTTPKVSEVNLAFGHFGRFVKYEFPNAVGGYHHISIVVPRQDAYDFEKYAGLKGPIDIFLEKEGSLTSEEIRAARDLIESLDNEELRNEKYLKLQEKVPYHSQRDNENSAREGMCNLTSEAMCLEMLGKENPDPSKQFEDNLEDMRVESKLADRILVDSRRKLADKFGVKVKVLEGTRGANRSKLTKMLLPHLKRGDGVMLSIGAENNGHLVRLQGITDEGLIIDDPYGEVDLIERNNGNQGYSPDTKNTNDNPNRGENNLWRWDDVEQITIKYAEIYTLKK